MYKHLLATKKDQSETERSDGRNLELNRGETISLISTLLGKPSTNPTLPAPSRPPDLCSNPSNDSCGPTRAAIDQFLDR